MPALTKAIFALATRPALGIALVCAASTAVAACKPKASESECDALLDRYARLVVTEKHPDASADDVAAEQQREKTEARGDDAFKNCSSEVSREELRCAMQAPTADAFTKCLE